MKAARLLLAAMAAACFAPLGGCAWAPKSQVTELETKNRVLAEHNRAQLVEIENHKAGRRDLEDRLVRTEQELALLQEQVELDQKRLANSQREAGRLHDHFKAVAGARRLPPEVNRKLADLGKRYPGLVFDPATGISKLDTDVLFESGRSELKPAAQAMLGELAGVLQSPEAGELKVMVVGHTDNQRIAGREVRDRFPNNFHLSTGRALAVADLMRRQGLADQRIGVAGFGPHQPIAPNASAADRYKNRRVEIFVMAADVPVVGWTDSMPSVY